MEEKESETEESRKKTVKFNLKCIDEILHCPPPQFSPTKTHTHTQRGLIHPERGALGPSEIFRCNKWLTNLNVYLSIHGTYDYYLYDFVYFFRKWSSFLSIFSCMFWFAKEPWHYTQHQNLTCPIIELYIFRYNNYSIYLPEKI